jgi:general secretion pathway protein E
VRIAPGEIAAAVGHAKSLTGAAAVAPYSVRPPAETRDSGAFGRFLVATGRLTEAAFERAERLAAEEGQSHGATLIGLGLIADRDLAEAYAAFLDIPLARREALPDQPVPGTLLNPGFLWQYRVIPVGLQPDHVAVAMADPLDAETIAAIRFAVGRPVRAAVAAIGDIDDALDRLYPEPGAAPAAADAAGADELMSGDLDRLRDSASEAPVIRMVNQIISRAVELRASDIHFETTPDGLDVRYRVDGILRDIERPPAALRAAIISRLKIMGTLDIAERRMAQDGRMSLAIRGRDIDFRISTMPTLHGESVVLRILDRAGLELELAALGFSGAALEIWNQAIRRTRGIVLITGPTGSGKTTTLYASVLAIADRSRKILTIEDPVEYQLPLINQTQVKPAVNLTFANALRWSLRHDPDVMMIGEIRDLEAARIAVQAALTGHLILSTLHTNDAAAAITRLIDLGIETYLLTSTINAVAAQRLVRVLCGACKRPEPLLPELAGSLGLTCDTVHEPAGCPACGGTGFRGRTALVEVLPMTASIKRLVLRRGDADEIREAAMAEGMRTMRQTGLDLVAAGTTSLDELLRVSDD